MAAPSDPTADRELIRRKIIGLGEGSLHKSYYPELQVRLAELELANARLEREVSERERAERALRDSERRYRLLFERNLAGVFRSNRGGRLLECNPAFAELLGADSPEAACRQSAWTLSLDSEVRHRMLSALDDSDGQLRNYELVLTRDDGKTIVLLANVNLIEESTGKAVLEGTVVDVTELRQADERLRLAQKMEAIGRLAGGVAHDFNNLLQATTSAVERFQRVLGPDDDQGRRLATELLSHFSHGARLTRQLLLFARRDTVRLESLDLNEVVSTTVTLLRRLIRENIEVEVELGSDPLTVVADRGELEQVLSNLAVNASDAMPDGGRMRVATQGDEARVVLLVEDNGHGIQPEDRKRVFEPFFTTKPAGQGTGLGLAVVRGIVDRLGGVVELGAGLEGGTICRVVLNRAWGATEVAGHDETVPGGLEGSARVLLVEDDDAVRRAIADQLDQLGYVVACASSIAEARREAAQTPVDLLLSDVLLPDGSGRDLALELSRDLGLAIVLMSGYPDSDALSEDVRAGRVRFLSKPFSVRELARELQSALGNS